ncbi:hypothetical protein [Metabacillus sp. FJAT-53654]|uniref:Uncharacterized protein n=1 Tax=Metabacillus rhizosphaerae TaxID=3117747 RepID=A0ABZ2MYR3_9BACI
MKKLLLVVLLLLIVYPLTITATEWKEVPQRNEMIGNTLIIENPNK